MPHRPIACAVLTAALFACLGAAAPNDWPDYRGPNRDGHSAATGLPAQWSETQNVVWKTPINGRGWSTPVLGGGRLWMTTAAPDGRRLFVVCVDAATGKVLLERKLFDVPRPQPLNPLNSHASPSPAFGGGRVYLHFGYAGTICLDVKTFRTLWARTDLTCDHSVGPGSTPVLTAGRLILTLDGTDTQRTYALDPATGKTIWTADRTASFAPGVAGDRRKSFNTPLPIVWGGQELLICPAAGGVYAYVAATGNEVWRVRHDGYSSAARVAKWKDLVFVTTGFDTSRLLAIRLGGSGDVTSTRVAWSCDRYMPFKPSPIVIGDRLYVVGDGGMLTVLDCPTGREVWRSRIPGNYSSSPIVADGRIFVFAEQTRGLVIEPGDALKITAENELSEGCMASPIAVGKALFIRTKAALYRLEKR